MAGPQQFDSFLRKFVNLWESGYHAKLYVEAEAGNACVNLQLALGQAQPAHGGRHQAVGGSRQRRRERRETERKDKAEEAAAEEAATAKAAEEASAAEEAADAIAAEEAADDKTAEEAEETGDAKATDEPRDEAAQSSGGKTGNSKCDVCEKQFVNLKNMRIHKAKQHKVGSSPIPQLDGAGSDFAAYEFTFEAHENCTDDDIVEALKTNFHCPLDDNKIEKNDPIRLFVVKKTKDNFKESNNCFHLLWG